MKTIFLYICNPVTKMAVIRTLMRNNLYYIEASNMDEVAIKLDLAENVGLMIQDYKEEEVENELQDMLKLIRAHNLPFLWIIPDSRRNLLSSVIMQQVTDILLLPFDESVFLRKINGILQIAKDQAKDGNMMPVSPQMLSYHKDDLINALESAAKGKYSVCIIRLQVINAYMEINLKLLDRLMHTLRGADKIIEVDLGEFLILCPFTSQQNLSIVEAKIRAAVDSAISYASSALKVNISGVCYPDDIRSFSELETKLTHGIENKQNIAGTTETAQLMKKGQFKFQNSLYQRYRKS